MLAGLLGGCIGWFVGSCLRIRRAHVVFAMRRAAIKQPNRVASKMYRQLGRGLCELLWLLFRPRRALTRVEFDPRLLEAVKGGAVIATAHTGNWDLLACAAAQRLPLTVVTKHFRVQSLDRVWQFVRRRHGVQLVAERQAAQPIRRALARGECVAMLIDQAPERQRGSMACRFLGEQACVDLTPAWMALRARVPLIVVFAKRLSADRHRAEFVARFDPPRRAERGWAERSMAAATAELETFVLNSPEQWLWMHRRWKRGARVARSD